MEEKLKNILKDKDYIHFAYLFGSQATGFATEKSDVDVAVYIDEGRRKDFFDIRLKLMEDITRGTKKDSDVIILNTAKPFLAFVVIQEGKLILDNRKKSVAEFELKAFNEYHDYKIFMRHFDD